MCIERQVECHIDIVLVGIGNDSHNGITRHGEIGRTLESRITEVNVNTRHACHEFGKVGHDIATFGDGTTATSAFCAVAHHAVVAFGSIVNPGIEVAQHTGIDGTEEIEKVLREIKVARVALYLVPVNQILRHPDLLTLLRQFLVRRLDATILVTAIDVEACQHVVLVQCVGVAVTDSQRLWSHHLGADAGAIGLYELGNLRGIPQTAGIRCRPVGFVLNADSIELHAILAQILHIVLQILGIVGPVFFLQFTRCAVFVLSIAGTVGFPLGRLSPW